MHYPTAVHVRSMQKCREKYFRSFPKFTAEVQFCCESVSYQASLMTNSVIYDLDDVQCSVYNILSKSDIVEVWICVYLQAPIRAHHTTVMTSSVPSPPPPTSSPPSVSVTSPQPPQDVEMSEPTSNKLLNILFEYSKFKQGRDTHTVM